MKLFYSEGSPYARMVRIALLELGLDDQIEKEIVTLRDPESALLPYNPVGRVPTLQLANGSVMTESLLIIFYLDTQHDRPPLLPRDGSDGWATLARLGTAMGLIDGIAVWNRALRLPEHERAPAVLALEQTRATRTLDALEPIVAAGAYSGRLDAAQIALGATLGYLDRRHRVFAWRDGHPALSGWFDTIAARPSFTATLPPIV